MGRPRHQEGFVEEVGGKVKKWKGHWFVYERGEDGREKRAHRSKVLGLKRVSSSPDGKPAKLSIADSKLPVMSKWEAERELTRMIAISTGGTGQTAVADSRVSFGWFWRNKWLPLRRGTWKPSTLSINMMVLEKHIGKRFDTTPLNKIDAAECADWLYGLAASDYSYSLIHKCYTYLKSITAEAVDQDYLTKNPLRKLKIPNTPDEDQTVLTVEQMRALHGQMKRVRDRAILELFVLTGLRPGEVFALRWNDLRGGVVMVDEAIVEGVIGETKTRGSKALVAVPAHAVETLEQWRKECPHTDEGWMFPSSVGKPIWRRVWDRNVLEPAAKRAKIERVNYQIFRRSWATWAHDAGVSLKAAQEQLRHASITTTGDVYTKAVSSSVKAAVETVSRKIFSE